MKKIILFLMFMMIVPMVNAGVTEKLLNIFNPSTFLGFNFIPDTNQTGENWTYGKVNVTAGYALTGDCTTDQVLKCSGGIFTAGADSTGSGFTAGGTLNATNGNFSKNVIVLGDLNATRVNASNFTGGISCSFLNGGSDTDFCADATSAGGESTNNSAINITDLIVRNGINATQDINTTKGSFFWRGDAIQDIFNRIADTFTRTNLTSFFGSDTDINNTILRRTNLSFFNPFWTKANTSDYLGGSDINASLLKTGNLTNIFASAYNIANNATNNTIPLGANASIALWNLTSLTDTAIGFLLYPRIRNISILIGNANTSKNHTSTLVIIGNVSVDGNLSITGTIFDNGTLNRSISLSSYNQSVSLVNYNQSISLVNYNQSVSLTLYNQSVSLVNYNQSVSLDNYLTTISSFFSSFFTRGNLTDFFGDTSINSSILRIGNLTNILAPTWQRANTTDYLGGTNGSRLITGNLSNIFASAYNIANNATNSTKFLNDTALRITTINMTANFSIQTNNSIFFNMSSTGSATERKAIYANSSCIIIQSSTTKFSICN